MSNTHLSPTWRGDYSPRGSAKTDRWMEGREAAPPPLLKVGNMAFCLSTEQLSISKAVLLQETVELTTSVVKVFQSALQAYLR